MCVCVCVCVCACVRVCVCVCVTPQLDETMVNWCYVGPRAAVAVDLCPLWASPEQPDSGVQPSPPPPPPPPPLLFWSGGGGSTHPLPLLSPPICPIRRYHHVSLTLPRRRSLLSWQPLCWHPIGRVRERLSRARKPVPHNRMEENLSHSATSEEGTCCDRKMCYFYTEVSV